MDDTTDRAAAVLRSALAVVTGARRQTYGTPEDNFGVIAKLWTCYLNERRKRSDDITRAILRWQDEHPADEDGPLNLRAFMSRGNIRLDGIDVAILMALMKIARLIESPNHMDSWVDLAGYAACGARCAGAEGLPDPTEPKPETP